LLDFWATWCQPCLAEMPSVKDIQQTFGADPRFVLAGLSCDDGIERPAEYVKANALTWTQAFAGRMLEGVAAEMYLIRAIPATFLIGPNGRVLATLGEQCERLTALVCVGMSLSLGSVWALVPASLSCGVLMVRTVWEDRTLQEELTGYKEYAQRARYKLVPGVW